MAAADLANWKDLKECIQGQDQTAEEKSVLLQRLEQLAERREESRAGALESLKAKKGGSNTCGRGGGPVPIPT